MTVTSATMRDAFGGIFVNSKETDIQRALRMASAFLSSDAWGNTFDLGVELYSAYLLCKWREEQIRTQALIQQVHQGEYNQLDSGDSDPFLDSNTYYKQFKQLEDTIGTSNPSFEFGLMT